MDGFRADESGSIDVDADAEADADVPIAIRARQVEVDEPGRLLADAAPPCVAWQTGAEDIAVRGAVATIGADGRNRFRTVQSRAEALFDRCESPDGLPEPARPRLYGGFGFTDYDGTERPWRGFPPAWFVLPAIQLVRTDGETWLTVAEADDTDARAGDSIDTTADSLEGGEPLQYESPPGVTGVEQNPSRERWREHVRGALAGIDGGDLEKVVLAQSLTATLTGDLDVAATLARLGTVYPDCFRFAFAPTGAGTFFGATPERLVARRGRTVRTEALAGSTGRGDTPAEDEWLAADLRESEKDRHEHQLVVDAIRDQLDPIATNVGTGPLAIRRLDTVQHLRTPITADLHTDDHVLSLVEALHPTPTVGGLPPERALATIRDTEAFDRGWYAGPIGWFDSTGDGDFAVAIRSAVAHGDGGGVDRVASADRGGGADRVTGTDPDGGVDRVTCFAGAGIVTDSEPDREYEEVQLKYRPILDALE